MRNECVERFPSPVVIDHYLLNVYDLINSFEYILIRLLYIYMYLSKIRIMILHKISRCATTKNTQSYLHILQTHTYLIYVFEINIKE